MAVTMGISRANVGRWNHGLDPSAENIAQIAQALSLHRQGSVCNFFLY